MVVGLLLLCPGVKQVVVLVGQERHERRRVVRAGVMEPRIPQFFGTGSMRTCANEGQTQMLFVWGSLCATSRAIAWAR